MAPLYKHVLPPAAPTLALLGLPAKIIPFPQFELQVRARARARVRVRVRVRVCARAGAGALLVESPHLRAPGPFRAREGVF